MPTPTYEAQKAEYREWVAQNDTYPKHDHTFSVRAYDSDGKGFRTFGPFPTSDEARTWFVTYRKKYTTKGFLPRFEIVPLCEPLNI